LDWQHGTAEGRLGVVSVVAPICAFAWEAHGLEPLLRQWGGESNYRQSGGSPATIERLTAISVPSIVEVALPSEVMAGPGRLWPVMVGTVLNLEEPFHEWQVRYSVPPASILAIIQPGDSHWPTGLDLIRS
jgi:hypothetical protein